MRLLATMSVALSVELLLGSALFPLLAGLIARGRLGRAERRRWIAWNVGGRALRRVAPYALGLLVASVVVWLLVRPLPAIVIWARPLTFLALGALPAAAAWVMLHAGWRERSGRLRSARRQMRLGGQVMFVGTLTQLILVWSDLIMNAPFRRAMLAETNSSGVILLLAMVVSGCAAFAGLVAGLAGKPRPSAYFVGLLYLCAQVGIVVAADQAAPFLNRTG